MMTTDPVSYGGSSGTTWSPQFLKGLSPCLKWVRKEVDKKSGSPCTEEHYQMGTPDQTASSEQ